MRRRGSGEHTRRSHTPCVPGGSWREAEPPLTHQRQWRIMSAGRAVWVKIRSSEGEHAEWHGRAHPIRQRQACGSAPWRSGPPLERGARRCGA